MKQTRPRSRTSRRRRLMIAAGVVFVLWAGFALWLLGTAWYSVPRLEPRSVPEEVSQILSPADYAALIDVHARPYVYSLGREDQGRVVVFGAEHTMRGDDPQLDEIREQWNLLRPTVALVESDLGMLFPAFMDPVETFGEAGFVHALARADSVPTYSWEPPVAVVLRSALDQGFTREQVALRWILNPYFSNLRHGRPADPAAFVRDTLHERSNAPGIAGELTTLADVEAAWMRAFPEGPDWRDVSDQFGLPGFLAEMDLNRARDVHLVSCLADLLRVGERPLSGGERRPLEGPAMDDGVSPTAHRVFVICGSSHAVKIEPALAALVE